jgi:hypothetical protein
MSPRSETVEHDGQDFAAHSYPLEMDERLFELLRDTAMALEEIKLEDRTRTGVQGARVAL